MTSINGLLANEIQDMSALKWVFCDSRVLVRKLASAFGHPTQVSTQVQLAPTCDYLPVRLTRALAEIELTSLIVKFHRKLFNYFICGISRFLDQYVS